jgi:hypothetical protein
MILHDCENAKANTRMLFHMHDTYVVSYMCVCYSMTCVISTIVYYVWRMLLHTPRMLHIRLVYVKHMIGLDFVKP